MTQEREALQRQLETGLNRYAILTAGVEFLFLMFDSPQLQRAFSRALSGGQFETEMRELQRFHIVDGKQQTWWSAPVAEIIPHKEVLIWWLVGETIIGSLRHLTTIW